MSLIEQEAEKLRKLKEESGVYSVNNTNVGVGRRFGSSLNKASSRIEAFKNKSKSENKALNVESRGTIRTQFEDNSNTPISNKSELDEKQFEYSSNIIRTTNATNPSSKIGSNSNTVRIEEDSNAGQLFVVSEHNSNTINNSNSVENNELKLKKPIGDNSLSNDSLNFDSNTVRTINNDQPLQIETECKNEIFNPNIIDSNTNISSFEYSSDGLSLESTHSKEEAANIYSNTIRIQNDLKSKCSTPMDQKNDSLNKDIMLRKYVSNETKLESSPIEKIEVIQKQQENNTNTGLSHINKVENPYDLQGSITQSLNPRGLNENTNENHNSNLYSNKIRTDFESNRRQSEYNLGIDRSQFTHNSDSDSNTYRIQKSKKLHSSEQPIIEKLRGLAHNSAIIFRYLHDRCSANRSLETGKVFRHDMMQKLNLTEATIKGTIKRMIQELRIIEIVSYKSGNGGWSNYSMNAMAYDLFSADRTLLNTYKSSKSKIYQPKQFEYNSDSNSNTNPSSELVSRNNSNLLTSKEPSWFKELDFSSVAPIKPIHVNSSIRKLVQEKLSSDAVQDFIVRYPSWIANQKGVNNYLGMFCDRLKEFANEGDSPILSSPTKEEIELELELAKEAEKLRKDLELIENHKKEQLRNELNAKFDLWLASATEEEKNSLYKRVEIINDDLYEKGLRETWLEKQGL